MDCFAFCTSTTYRIRPLYEALRTRFKAAMYRDILHVELVTNESTSDLFFFPYGVMVSWGLSKEQALAFLDEVRPYEQQRNEELETDEFTFVYGDAPKIVEDEIILPNTDILTKLAISQGIAQSVKLGIFESAIQKTFNATKQIPVDLAKQGKILLSKKEIRRKMGELFIERASINLHLDVLDTPEFFWEYPELEPLYKLISLYLDITTRVEIMNQRLDVIHELFEMLGNELNHQHSSRLELTIIWLIVIEVLLTLMRDVFQII